MFDDTLTRKEADAKEETNEERMMRLGHMTPFGSTTPENTVVVVGEYVWTVLFSSTHLLF